MKFICTYVTCRDSISASDDGFMVSTRRFFAPTPLEAVKKFWSDDVIDEYDGLKSLGEFCLWMWKHLNTRVSVYCVDNGRCYIDGVVTSYETRDEKVLGLNTSKLSDGEELYLDKNNLGALVGSKK